MTGQNFFALNSALIQCLQAIKNGEAAEVHLNKASQILRGTIPNRECDLSERQTCLAATFSALRVILEQSVATKRIQSICNEYIQVVDILFSIELAEVPIFAITWGQVRPIISALLYISDLSEANHEAVLRVFCKVTTYIDNDTDLSENFYGLSFLPGIGKTISMLFALLTNDSLAPNLRLLCIESLTRIIAGSSSRSMVVLLPGTLRKLADVMRDPNNSTIVIIKSLELFQLCVVRVFAEDSSDDKAPIDVNNPQTSQVSSLLAEKNDKWLSEASQNIISLVKAFSAVLVTNDSKEVHLRLLQFLRQLIDVNELLTENVQKIALDVCAVLADDDMSIGTNARELLSTIENKNSDLFSEHFHKLFLKLKANLTVGLGTSGSSTLLSQVMTVIRVIPSMKLLFIDGTLHDFLGILVQAITLDAKKMLVSTYEESTLEDFILSLPLTHGIPMKWLQTFSTELIKQDEENAFSLLSDLLVESRTDQRVTIALMLSFASIKIRGQKSSASISLLKCAEVCQQFLNRVKIDIAESDASVKDNTLANTENMALITSIVLALSSLIGSIDAQDCNNTILVDVFCSLLLASTMPNFLLSKAALLGLDYIAQSRGTSLAKLLEERDVLIINKIWQLGPRVLATPRLLSAFIQNTNNPSIFSSIEQIIKQLMITLDQHNQENSIATLRAFTIFIESTLRWFPELADGRSYEEIQMSQGKPSSTKKGEDEEKQEFPEPIRITEQILSRTRHLLSSPHVPVKIECLRLLSTCLRAVRAYDDVLLPMIHQNWMALRNRLEDENFGIRIESIRVLAIMCESSTSFVYRKVRNDGWPRLMKWAEKELGRSQYTQSEKYRLLFEIVSNTATIWIAIRPQSKDDLALFLPFLHKVMDCNQCPAELRLKAKEALEILDEKTLLK